MRYSQLFGKTVKAPPKDATTTSHKLLYQGGFIRESTAGRYYFLPLGIRAQQKLMAVVKEEMDNAGAQEMVTPVLHPLELWEETNRVSASNFELMMIQDRRGAKFALGGTAEEMVVDLVRKFQISYRDLPFNIYQFSTKFRDEMRARGGLLRVREFIMKDGYSFHATSEDFEKEYKNMWQAYSTVYQRLGLQSYAVPADNGYFGGDYCHEFIVESSVGESTFFVSEDNSYIAHEDIAQFTRTPINPDQQPQNLETIDQPAWVKTMEDNVKHYGKDAAYFLKNVVYKNRVTGEIFIAVIRGDLEVNKNKLEHATNSIGQLDDATDQDLASFGSKSGYVHSWGHTNVTYVGDLSLTSVKNFIGGQKTETTDTINVNYDRDFKCKILADIALAKPGYLAPDSKSKLQQKTGIEVGNIFQLGQHYSTKMAHAEFIDPQGKSQKYYMGCYGLGIGRTLATVVEIHHDDKGIIWPEIIAPYQVHLVGLNLDDETINNKAEDLYKQLQDTGIEVLYDDRPDVAPGAKFADADLLGMPYRLVISKRTGDQVELKRRNETDSQLLSISEALTQFKK